MKRNKLYIFAVAVAMLLQGCTTDEVDYREKDYGYVQFKLYKEASYSGDASLQSRAEVVDQLEFLADAHKIEVSLTTEQGVNIKQNLVLTAADSDAAEYGLRSDKLKLLEGTYTVGRIVLYNALDEVLYRDVLSTSFIVSVGGLTMHDIVVDVVPRGKLQFTFKKDFSDFTETPTRGSVNREYMIDEVKYVDLTLKKVAPNLVTYGNPIELQRLPVKIKEGFDANDGKENYKTGWLECDTLLTIEANRYRVMSYKTFDERKTLLEEYDTEAPADRDFVVEDNETTNAEVKIKLHEADEYIKDYYALYEIWKALDGENWYYDGESYPRGANWDFNRDVDMWYQQSGVQVHSNGRVARLDLSGFGIKGYLPDAIGQLTELVELELGTHNDTNVIYDPMLDSKISWAERKQNRMKYGREYLEAIHQPVQMSEPCAFALKYHGIDIPAISLYEKYSEAEIIDKKTGEQRELILYDMNHGTIVNSLRGISPEIGKCVKLEKLFIANGLVEELPSTLVNLTACTDLEIYNCSKMTKFPMVIAEMPSLVQVNLSNNKQWSSEEIDKGMAALASGKSAKSFNIIYARENNMTKIGKEFSACTRLGLLDLAKNKIKTVEALGDDVCFSSIVLDNNLIESIPAGFCSLSNGYNSLDSFSVSNNRLTKVPNIFDAKSDYTLSSINLSSNLLDDNCFVYENGETFKGLRVETLTLSRNPLITKYPKALAETNSLLAYIILSACEVDEIPEGSFEYKNSVNLVSMDLSYNNLSKLPKELHAGNLPYLYGFDISFNRFSKFPYEPLDSSYLTVYGIRSQRDAEGRRCLREWPNGLYNHTGLRGFFIGSNDLGKIDDKISYLIYNLDISDNPNIIFDASDICYYWSMGSYILIYDKTQDIRNCDAMLE